jgi:hypothetical protein
MQDDRIFPLTKIIAVIVIPFLWAAFLILWLVPDQTGERFAWAIKPHMTSLYIGAGYLGGSWFFISAVFGKRWHRLQGGFLPITIFTWAMLIATFLHWDRFSHGQLGFDAWLILYLVTPFLVPALWLYNRRTDNHQPEASDLTLAMPLLWISRLVGVGLLLFAFVGFIFPSTIIFFWPWTLTPLTGRVLSGWFMLLGVGGLVMAADNRWSAWRMPLESNWFWHLLVLIAAWLNPADFKPGALAAFSAIVAVALTAVLVFYIYMERHRRMVSHPERLATLPQ